MAETGIRVGIGGWTYPPWRDNFYPAGLPHRQELAFAAASFGAIEINATFYGRQQARSWESWAAAVPEGFQFAVKGSRYVISRPRLADAGGGIGHFLAQGLTALGDKLGPILWILAARRTFDREDIAAFFRLLPQQVDGITIRHVIEPRHESFRCEAFLSLCRDHGIAVVFGDDDEFPQLDADTAGFRYARLQRMRSDVPTGYSDGELDHFAAIASQWRAKGRDSYLFMINGAKERAPAAALALQRLLAIARS